MARLTAKQFDRLKPISNHVLIRIEKEFEDKVRFKDGTEILIDVRFSQGKHSVVKGDVIKVPDKLTSFDNNSMNNMDWETTMQLKIGDRVFISWDAVRLAFTSNPEKLIICNEKVYILINYGQIFVAKRKLFYKKNELSDCEWDDLKSDCIANKDGTIDRVMCLNGYVLIHPIKLKDTPGFIDSDIVNIDTLGNKLSENYGTVKFKGENNHKYRDENITANISVEVGDMVMLSPVCNLVLEYTPSFNDDMILYRVQSHLIKAVIRTK